MDMQARMRETERSYLELKRKGDESGGPVPMSDGELRASVYAAKDCFDRKSETTYGGIAGGLSQSVAVEEQARQEMRAQAAYERMAEANTTAPMPSWATGPTAEDCDRVYVKAARDNYEALKLQDKRFGHIDRPSMAERAFKRADHHADVANKALAEAEFFKANPAFEEFIRLIRSGAIQL